MSQSINGVYSEYAKKKEAMNEKAIGTALVGNFNYKKPTPNQLQSLAFLLSVLRNYYLFFHVVYFMSFGFKFLRI
jgi:N-acetylmuramoyl-L-alanine amidase